MNSKAFLIFALLCALTLSKLIQGQLKILEPEGLKDWWKNNPQATHTSLATFGENPWGRKLSGSLKLASPLDACDTIRQDGEFIEHPFLIVQRGNCTFSRKAHFAQLAGAKMMLIADIRNEDVEKILMVEDGTLGEQVKIPLALLTKQAGQVLIDSLKDPNDDVNNIQVLYDFTLPTSDKVTYHLWLSSATSDSFRFVTQWKSYYDQIKDYTSMEVHYAHYQSPSGVQVNSQNCMCGTKYCAPDPDGQQSSNTGRDVLYEDLRQICIYKKFGLAKWWQYVLNYDAFCMTSGRMEDCDDTALFGISIDPSELDECIKKSFNGDVDSCQANKYFDDEFDKQKSDAIFLYPSIEIGDLTFRGNLLPPNNVFETICESFNTMPEACQTYFHLSSQGTTDNEEPIIVTVTNQKHLSVVIAAVVFLFLFGCFVCSCYRLYLKKEMKRQMVRDVNVAVSQYIAMKDTDDD